MLCQMADDGRRPKANGEIPVFLCEGGSMPEIIFSQRPRPRWRVWVFSDLQQSEPSRAERCMRIAVDDFQRLNLPCDQLWYLGDAVEGENPELVRQMVQIQLELLRPLGVPLRYVNGNHDFDLFQFDPNLPLQTPFWAAVSAQPGWRTTARLDEFYFWEELGGVHVLFMSDHCDVHANPPRWTSTHGALQRGPEQYPHSAAVWADLKAQIAAKTGPVIIAGHGAFPGGNRAGALMQRLLPLPENVKLVLYGHAHIGDLRLVKENVYRKIAYVDHQRIPQVDVASLEDARGDEIRSAIVEYHTDGSLLVLFRDHKCARWPEVLAIGASR